MRFLFLLLAFISSAYAERPPISGPALVAPLIVDGQRLEQAWIFPNSNLELFKIEAASLLRLLQKYLPEADLLEWRQKVQPQGVFSLQQLQSAGYEPRFDERTLDIFLKIPSDSRKHKEIALIKRGIDIDLPVAESAPYSGYLNLRGSNYFIYPSVSATRQPFIGNLELVNQLLGWSLETGYDYFEKNEYEWRRSDTSIVHDFEKSSWRLRLGDLQTSTSGYQSSRSLGGVSLAKVFSIQPYSVSRPISRTEILLERPATVEVFINGVRINQLRLPAGPVNLKDFPLSMGRNQVQIKITDDLGRVEIRDLSLLYDAQNLGKGIHEFYYAAGSPWMTRNSDRHYLNNPTGTFFHRYGLNDRFTLGWNYQGDKIQHLAGTEWIWLNKISSLNWNISGSKINGNKADFASLLQMQSLESYGAGERAPIKINFESEYKGGRFTSIGNTIPLNRYLWSFDLYSSLRKFAAMDFGLGYRYQFGRGDFSDYRQVRSDITYVFAQNWRSTLNFSRTLEQNRETRFYITLTWVESSGRTYLNSSYETPSKSARMDIIRNPEIPYNAVKWTGSVQRSPSLLNAGIQADYTGYRFDARLDHQVYNPKNSQSYQQTGLNLASAIAWTNSALSWSRPINDSFVILPRSRSLKNISIPINGSEDSAESFTNNWGPAVLPVNSYLYNPVNVDTTNFPIGYTLEKEYLYAKPIFNSGVTIPLGAESSLLITGILKNSEKEPIALLAGEIKSVSDPTWKPKAFFTNRAGRYVVEGIKPGKYRVEFFDGDWRQWEFDIPEVSDGLWKMPEQILTRGGE